MNKIRPLAIYLPQFHPIPENDKAWGEGFTEWTNVKKATPLYEGHYQPHIPDESVGYYDLRDPEVLIKQAAMAKEHGIYGFAFYHYWFNGKRLLNLPIDNMLKLKKPDFPFCLIWANENWTKRWDGLDHEIIIKQNYSFNDDQDHIKFLCENVFNDRRYIKIEGKPLFVVYKPTAFPQISKTIEIWRHEARKYGFADLYLCFIENNMPNTNPTKSGFDACIEFQPRWHKLPYSKPKYRIRRILQKINASKYIGKTNAYFAYRDVVNVMRSDNNPSYKIYPGLTPMWDNSPRKKNNALILTNSTPKLYGKWLQNIIDKFIPYSDEENFIFINAWNEWAEGNHLEPCKKWGYKYLEETKSVLSNV